MTFTPLTDLDDLSKSFDPSPDTAETDAGGAPAAGSRRAAREAARESVETAKTDRKSKQGRAGKGSPKPEKPKKAPGEKGKFAIEFVGKKLKQDELSETLDDLAAMLEAGESEELALLQLAKQYAKTNVGVAYGKAAARMRDDGWTLVDALSAETDTFPRVARELIAASSTPRGLAKNLRQAALIVVEGSDIKARIRASMFGPSITFSLVLVFVFVAGQFLLPGVADMFRSIGKETPPLTAVMMSVAGSLIWVILGIVGAGVVGLLYWGLFGRRVKRFRIHRDRMAVTMPLSGPIMQMSMAARFADVLSACLSSGMSELDALDVAGRASGNEAVEQHVVEHIKKQQVGDATFTDVADSKLFPWNMKSRMDLSPSPQHTIQVLRDLGEVFHKKANRRMNAFADKLGKFTEIGVLGAAATVILLVALPVLTFLPSLMQGLQG